MAIQLDTRIPLQAAANPLDFSGALQKATAFNQQQQLFQQQSRANDIAQRLSELKADFEARKMKRDQAVEQGMADELAGMTAGTPAVPEKTSTQYIFPTPRTVVDQPAIPATPPRQPSVGDLRRAQLNALFKAGDMSGLMDALKGMRPEQAQYAGTPVIGRDGQYHVLNQLTGQYEPTGVYQQQKPVESKKQVVRTARGLEVVDLNQIPAGSVLPPEVEKSAAEKPDMTPFQRITMEGKLRDDYRSDSKTYNEMRRQYSTIKAALNDPSAAGTLAAATSYMKLLDPGSVVRESELGMAMNTQGTLGRLQSYWTTIEQGKTLTAEQKSDFGRLSDQYMRAAEQAQENVNRKYSELARNYGLNERNVIMQDMANKPTGQRAPLLNAVGYLKTQNISNQSQFNAAVRSLKAAGWTDDEIRAAAAQAGL